MSDEKAKTGERIVKMRKSKRITQKELGERLNVEHNTVSGYEKGNTYPSIEALRKMTELFDCSSDELLGIQGSDTIEVGWKNLINELKRKNYTPDKISKILELHEQIQKLVE